MCVVILTGCAVLSPRAAEAPPATSRIVSQVAYVGADDQIYVAAEAGGSGPRLVTVPRAIVGVSSDQDWVFRWPTYSPDGRRLAFAGYRSRSGQIISAALLVSDVGGVDEPGTSLMLESSELTPIYLYWSPDNRHLSVLLQRAQTLELHLLDTAGQEQPQRLLVGQPLYWSWAPDGQTLAVHLGDSSAVGDPGWVGLLHLEQSGGHEERFVDTPGQFRAPAWSPDGRALAYAALGGGVSIVTVRDAGGATVRLASGATDVAFGWAPGSEWLAFAFGSSRMPGVYQGLEIVRADGTERRRLSQDPLLAFTWSPDGQRLALITLDRAAQALSWSVVGLDSRSRVLASFVPTSDFAFQLPFFDQYAQSSTMWSADGRKLVYGAQGGGERSNGSATGERLMLLDADGQAAPSMLARGSVGVWSPRER